MGNGHSQTQEHSAGALENHNHNEKNILNLEMGSPTTSRTSRMLHRSHKWKRVAISTDEISRIIFPMGFAVFNIAYWVYYLYMIAESDPLGTDMDVVETALSDA